MRFRSLRIGQNPGLYRRAADAAVIQDGKVAVTDGGGGLAQEGLHRKTLRRHTLQSYTATGQHPQYAEFRQHTVMVNMEHNTVRDGGLLQSRHDVGKR